MQIILKSLSLLNFKGIKQLSLNFNNGITNIYGANNSGKTTVVDAFNWLLFGKNSEERSTSNFNIKTLDKDKNFIPKLEHKVEGVLTIDGDERIFTRTLKQRWEKPNGDTKKVYRGDTTEFFIDGVPLSETAYKQRISEIIDSEIFKQITNPTYFNSLQWQKQREMLIGISPAITDESIIAENPQFAELTAILAKYNIEDFTKKTSKEITKINEQLAEKPARISELQNSMPAPVDIQELEAKRVNIETALKELDGRLTDNTSAFSDYKEKQNKIFQLESRQKELKNIALNKFEDLKTKTENKVRELERKLLTAREQLGSRESLIESKDAYITEQNQLLQQLRAEAVETQKEEFVLDEYALLCPTCNKPLDNAVEKREELQANFNRKKADNYLKIKNKGEAIKADIAKTSKIILSATELVHSDVATISKLEQEIKHLQTEIAEMKPIDVTESDEYCKISVQIEELKAKLELPKEQTDIDDIRRQKEEKTAVLDSIKEQLSSVTLSKKMEERIKELLTEEKKLCAEKAKKERLINLCEEFTKAKMTKLEDSVNSMFKLANFKLFKQQKNGGEAPDCVATYNGVPYSDLNSAARINIGLDIINTLCGFYDINAPIFIDNRESVTEIIKCDSQIVNFRVSDNDKKLRLEIE